MKQQATIPSKTPHQPTQTQQNLIKTNAKRSDDPKERERRNLAKLIDGYARAEPRVHPLYW
jgi:uncharacterized protein with WD repeat